ncbi:uncharacterized protein LOC126068268 [Elephas maximus indicus]|uniref:uncharacterized protein LOC126068268 n=1 Tax=Elephas maximus indicus TaxID=99487 RepID=UPI002116C3E9|nr:uncharacterized protein LOC126068268 [Elephas maximus indicus]
MQVAASSPSPPPSDLGHRPGEGSSPQNHLSPLGSFDPPPPKPRGASSLFLQMRVQLLHPPKLEAHLHSTSTCESRAVTPTLCPLQPPAPPTALGRAPRSPYTWPSHPRLRHVPDSPAHGSRSSAPTPRGFLLPALSPSGKWGGHQRAQWRSQWALSLRWPLPRAAANRGGRRWQYWGVEFGAAAAAGWSGVAGGADRKEEAGPAGLLTSRWRRAAREAVPPPARGLLSSAGRRPAGPWQLLRPPAWQRRAGASAEAGVGAAATAVAFLRLRDQEGNRNGIRMIRSPKYIGKFWIGNVESQKEPTFFRNMCVSGSDEDLDEAWVMKTFKAGSLEKLVELLVPAYLKDDFSYIEIFLGAYRTYATIQQVLEHLLQRYGCNHPYSAEYGEPQEQLKGAISFILGTWLKEYLEDFNQPPDFPCLKLVVEYVYVNMPGSHLEHDTQLLLAQLDQMEVTEAEPEALKPGPAPTAKEAQELTLPQEPAPGQSPGVHSAPVAAP